MINYKIKNGSIAEMDVRGKMDENLVDVAMLINGIYSMLAKARPDAAEVFKRALVAGIAPGSPIREKRDYEGLAIVKAVKK